MDYKYKYLKYKTKYLNLLEKLNGGNEEKTTHTKYAWVTLLMLGDKYMPGCLVTAKSLRNVNTKYDIVCMVTNDVSIEARNDLKKLYDFVIDIDYISHPSYRSPYRILNKNELTKWYDHSFTKWQCLNFTQYEKVLFVDSDVLFMENCDDLFELNTPSATFGHTITKQFKKDGLNDIFTDNGKRKLKNGDIIPRELIIKSLKLGKKSFVLCGCLVLLKPDKNDFKRLIDNINSEHVYGKKWQSNSGSDEISIALLYNKWHVIEYSTIFPPWKQKFLDKKIRINHYMGKNFWDMKKDEWEDLKPLWKTLESIQGYEKWLPKNKSIK